MKMKTRELILVSLFAALTAVGAFIRIPIPYVPFTLQFLFCAFAGILLGSKLGAISQIVYVLVGLIGIPVFTEGGGPGYIFKPTFGYLIGFIAAAYVIGKITEKIKELTLIKALLATLSGLFFVYLFGVSYLYLIYNLYLGQSQNVEWAIFYGFTVCIGGDLFLSLVVAVTAVKVADFAKKSRLTLN
ncbi:MAG: biotin transporter BioY [Clostridiaceae bacterium]|nr:biotin transporter BioY [Clostridiaceae bacterium]